MGNQISLTRKRKQLQNKSSSTSLSTRTFPDSINGNGSITSSTPPKFLADLFPGTLIEANRQQGEHYLYKHLFQVSYFAPIDNILSKSGSTALDIACGPHASWVLDVANDFPDCTFYGFDIIEPFSLPNTETNSCHIPDNCKLQQLDILDAGINYPDNTFDFVHQRNINMVYQYDKIQWLIGEVLRVTKDDGWIEFVEPDLCPKRAGPIFTKLSQAGNTVYIFCILQCIFTMVNIAIRYAKQRLGGFFEGNKLTAFMKEAGLVDIKSDYGSLPVCWGGYIGKLVYEV